MYAIFETQKSYPPTNAVYHFLVLTQLVLHGADVVPNQPSLRLVMNNPQALFGKKSL